MEQKERLQQAVYTLNTAATCAESHKLTPRYRLELIINQNLFWAEACFYAVERIADTVVYHRKEIYHEEPYVAMAHLAAIGNMLLTGTHGFVEDLYELAGDEYEEGAQ